LISLPGLFDPGSNSFFARAMATIRGRINDFPKEPPRETIDDSHRLYPRDGVAPLTEILRLLHGTEGREGVVIRAIQSQGLGPGPLQRRGHRFGQYESGRKAGWSLVL
jgi:hypothetical protein